MINIKKNIRDIIITFFYIWNIKKSPWTFWSLGAFLMWLFFIYYLNFEYYIFFILSIILFFISIPLINSYENDKKEHDLKEIVIDEVLWMFITIWIILFFSNDILLLFLWFIFFRFFDIFKPSIIWYIDKNISWWFWVLLDDAIAWFFAWIVVILWFLFYLKLDLIFYYIYILLLQTILIIYITKRILEIEKIKEKIIKNKFLQPNFISIFRVFICLLWLIIYIYIDILFWMMLFALWRILDFVDWEIARKCNLQTELWKTLDPLTDKISYFLPIIYFAFIWYFNIILVIILFLIDFWWQFSRNILKKLNKETKANNFWKIKTSLIFIFIFTIFIFQNKINNFYYDIFLYLIIFFALLSIIFKFFSYKNLIINLKNKIWI